MDAHRILSSVALVAAGALLGCGGAATGEGGTTAEGAAVSEDPLAIIDDAEDGRAITSGLRALSDHPEAAVRERLGLALGRIGGPAAAGALVALLDDPVDAVRDAAVFGSGLLGDDAGEELVAALGTRLEVEQRPAGVALILEALSRTGDVEVSALITARLDDGDAGLRAAAARALGLLGQRGRAVPDDIVRAVAAGLDDGVEEVRFMSAFALYRIADPLPGPPEALAALVKAAAGDDSAEVRAYSLRGVARRGGLDAEVLERALADDDERVGATAVSVLAFVGEETRCDLVAVGLAALATRLEADPAALDGARAHATRAVLDAAVGCADTAGVKQEAGRIEKLAAGREMPRTAGASRALCLARLAAGRDDLELLSCDPAAPHRGKRTLVRRLSRGAETPEGSLATLLELADDPHLAVATAALDALGAIPTEPARARLLAALDDERALVVAAALDAVAMNADGFVIAAEGGARNASPELIAAIEKVVARFTPFDHAFAPLVSAAAALAALGDPLAGAALSELVADPRPVVRGPALEAIAAIDGLEPPEDLEAASPGRRVPAATKAEWRGREVLARVKTTRGEIVLELRSDVAPATVESFSALAADGYFDGTEVHRVVPNFVVQAGDPTATGLGDPGYALRCEVSSLPYERGTVGMALAGKDTGGSQLFITHSRQPHLDAHYTVFGRVVEGMDVVDLLEVGDAIRAVEMDVED